MISLKPSAADDSGLTGVRRLAGAMNENPEHATQVRAIALALFDETVELHGLDPAERRLLEAAALLHDIGHSMRRKPHHKASRDGILDAEFEEFTEREQRMIACVARYHRKAHPKRDHRIYRDLDPVDQVIVHALAAILRIADGLDRAHASSVAGVRARLVGDVLRITVTQRFPFEEDVEGGMRKRRLFEQTFGVTVEIEAEPAE